MTKGQYSLQTHNS